MIYKDPEYRPMPDPKGAVDLPSENLDTPENRKILDEMPNFEKETFE